MLQNHGLAFFCNAKFDILMIACNTKCYNVYYYFTNEPLRLLSIPIQPEFTSVLMLSGQGRNEYQERVKAKKSIPRKF